MMNEITIKVELIERLEKVGKEMLALAAELKGVRAESRISMDELKAVEKKHGKLARELVAFLDEFDIKATVTKVTVGPIVSRVVFTIPQGTRFDAVTSLKDNIMATFRASSIRIEAPVCGEDAIAIELPNAKRQDVELKPVLKRGVPKGCNLPLFLGKTSTGEDVVDDLATLPHLIIGGAVGQGKTVAINSIICGLISNFSPEEVRLILADPKCVEFSGYAGLPHLVMPVITTTSKFVFAMNWAVAEMEKRLKMFARAQCRNIQDFNKSGKGNAPYIVIIVDELADFMNAASKEIVPSISRLTALARATGIHLILATQRSDAKVLSGTVKANVPGRMAFKTCSKIDSRTILDERGAEDLIGRGDALYRLKDGRLMRIQVAKISDKEIVKVVKKAMKGYDKAPLLVNAEDEPEIQRTEPISRNDESDYKAAIEVIKKTNRASVSHLQRNLGFGYNHAAKIIKMLEERGVVAPAKGLVGARTILMDLSEEK